MLNTAKALKGYKLGGLDGEIGKVKEFYFDDQDWVVRYLVVDTGNWLAGRHVLISPYNLVDAIKEEGRIAIDLTKKQIEDSPSLSSDKPVSRQFEDAYLGYYGMPMNLGYVTRGQAKHEASAEPENEWDPHLRSTSDVSGHHIQAADGEIGHVENFILDDEAWAIRYLIINTQNWWPGKKILLAPQWIGRISWTESKVFVNLTRENIKQSPAYTDETLVTREYEAALHRHYSRQGYWVEELGANAIPITDLFAHDPAEK